MDNDCGCGTPDISDYRERSHSKEVSQILNKWVLDKLERKLLIQEPIYDIYNDIIGYITKNTEGNIVRIFSQNIKQILD
jgi:hypothetical protein